MVIAERNFHRAFEIGVLLKGAHALIECLGGLALAVVSTGWIVGTIGRLTQAELIEDPHDFLATHLAAFAGQFSASTQNFYAFYLLSHGVVKLALVVGLLKGKLWAYPASLVVLLFFIAYQVYRYSYTHSLGLVVLTLFDLLVMYLVWHEYRVVRQARRTGR